MSHSRTRMSVLASTALMVTVAVGVPAGSIMSRAEASTVVDTTNQTTFIESIAPMAQQSQRDFGVPASVTIAQAILESGWGRSTLTTEGHAYFGIKCSPTQIHATGCIDMETREVFDGEEAFITDGFRTYPDPDASFTDHGNFLRVNDRYAPAFDHPDDPDQFIREVHNAGYATDPGYADMVIGLMRDHDLYRFDDPQSSAPAPETPEPQAPGSEAPKAPAPSNAERPSAEDQATEARMPRTQN